MAELSLPRMDFSAIGNLGETMRQNDERELIRNTLAGLGQGGPVDPMTLIKSGNLQLANLGVGMMNRNQDQSRQAMMDAETIRHNKFMEGIQSRTADRLEETPLDKANQRAEVLRANGIDPNSPEGRSYMIGGEWSGSVANKNGLQPIYGTDANGKPVIMQMNPSGTATRTQLPEGVTVSRDPIKIDQGTSYLLLDPITRQQIGLIPKDLAGAEREKILGEETAKAQVALPQTMSAGNQILKTISDVKNHPGLDWSIGMFSKAPTIPGTQQANFRAALDQLKGQTFLQAYQQLKGGGAITDIEGVKGENAIARMNTAQTKEAFLQAASDFEDVVKAGMLRASAKSRGAGSGAAPTEPGNSSGRTFSSSRVSQGSGADTMLQQARDAIQRGANKEAVLARLQAAGIDPGGL